jgi:plastocyanin
MENDFRKRWATPLLLMAGVLVLMAGFAFSVSRVLLAVPETVATLTALAIAAYVLLLAGLTSKQRRLSARALGGGLVVGLVGLVAAGVVAAQAGMRDLHGEEEAPPGDGVAEEMPADAYVWVPADIEYLDAPTEIPAGAATIGIDNQGNILHDVTFEGADVFVEANGGEQAWDEFTLQPGTYTYFCSVPGHRAAGMEGTVEVTG